jgi:hypothetical protein
MDILVVAVAFILAWILAACAVVAAILGFVGLRHGISGRHLAWAYSVLFAPLVFGLIVVGGDLVAAQFRADVWWIALPLWFWIVVVAILSVCVVVSIVKGDIREQERARG